MKRTHLFHLPALTAVALAASSGMVAAAPAGLSAADWANLQQQVPFITQQAYLKDSVSSVSAYFGWSVAVSGDTL